MHALLDKGTRRNGRVLLVDDSSLVRERLTEILSEIKDIEIVAESRDCLDTTDFVQNLGPDVIVLDIEMHGANWTDVFGSMKNSNPAPKVMILTNSVYPQVRAKCLQLGADFFFDKSTELDKAIEVLATLCPEPRPSG